MRRLAVLLALAAFATPVAAEEAGAAGCPPPAAEAEAATPPMPGDGTAPGNASTGWTGGLGGSHTGTNTAGAVAASRTEQPPTARGLDLLGPAEEAAC